MFSNTQLDQVYRLKYKICLNNSITKLKLLVHIYSFLLLVLDDAKN